MDFEGIDAQQILSFLKHLEDKRRNTASTRNVRLSAFHAFFRYMATQHPERLEQCQRILVIPFKRARQRTIEYLEYEEMQQVLSAVGQSTTISQWLGHASPTTTNKYATIDLEMKREALAKVKPIRGQRAGGWRNRSILDWLEGLSFSNVELTASETSSYRVRREQLHITARST